ncbi:MAG: hypothetical protein IT450_11105 [Phycisphaerales bacterium]|nr:hypothetical protein [Phycisphaerales bacterium]
MEGSRWSGAVARGAAGSCGRGTWRGTRRKSAFARVKPEGGFCFVPALALIAAWWAYKRSIVKLADLRVWLAIFEVVARRCGDHPRRFPPGVEHELAELTGLSIEVVRSALRRLERTGLVRRHRTVFEPVLELSRLSLDEQEDFRRTLGKVVNHRRRVPVPRRLLRFLCVTSRQVLLATTLEHLLRCMYYRNRQCAPDGRCKASWVADVMEVDLRNVKAARRELVELGVLLLEPTHQRHLNRWGALIRFNLAWSAPALRPSPPPRGRRRTKSPPPYTDRKLALRMENQEPGCAALGVGGRRAWHVEPQELTAPVRLQRLFERSTALGLVRSSEAARLAFFATAARAVRVSTRNAAGLFATLVRNGRWEYATSADEDQGRRWILQLRLGPSARSLPPTVHAGRLQPCPPGSIESAAAVLARVMGSVAPSRAGVAPAPPGRRGRKEGEFEGEPWNDGSPSIRVGWV